MRVAKRIEGCCEEEVPLRKVCQESRSPEEGCRYSWLEGCLEQLEGKEARHEYYARLEERPASQ